MLGATGRVRHRVGVSTLQAPASFEPNVARVPAGSNSRTFISHPARATRPRWHILIKALNNPDNRNGTGNRQRRSFGAEYPAGAATPPSEPVVTIVTGEDGRPMAVAIATMGDGVVATAPPTPAVPKQVPAASVPDTTASVDAVQPSVITTTKASSVASSVESSEPATATPSVQHEAVVAVAEEPVSSPFPANGNGESPTSAHEIASTSQEAAESTASDTETAAAALQPAAEVPAAALPEPVAEAQPVDPPSAGPAPTPSTSAQDAPPEPPATASSSDEVVQVSSPPEAEPVQAASSSEQVSPPPGATPAAAAPGDQQSPSVSGPSREARRLAKMQRYKIQLLTAVASLDRGLAANVQEAKDVDAIAQKLEIVGGDVHLNWMARGDNSSTMEQLVGTWRLIYSSGFNTGSLGGSRPGPPAAVVPAILGQVYQRIDADKGKLDNIVEFLLNYSLPSLPLLGGSERESPAIRLTLGHDYSVLGDNTLEIVYEDTGVALMGSSMFSQLPPLELPQVPEVLKPPKFLRSATFNVSFLDDVMRITRGDRGELRIYLKDRDLDTAIPEDEEA